MFEHAFKVRAAPVRWGDIVKGLDESLANELLSLHDENRRVNPGMFSDFRYATFITKGTSDNPHFRGIGHRRTQFSDTDNGSVAGKGTGINNFQEDATCKDVSLEYLNSGSIRRYPISRMFVRGSNAFSSYWLLGGMPIDDAKEEFWKFLTISSFRVAAGLKPASVFPISVGRPLELPVLDDGDIRIVGRDEYCDQTYLSHDRKSRPVKTREFPHISTLHYFGRDPVNRVRMPRSRELMRNKSDAAFSDVVENFAREIGSTMSAAHVKRATFTYREPGTPHFFSSLSSGNVSISGEIYDAETFWILPDGADAEWKGRLVQCQFRDLKLAAMSLAKLSSYKEDDTNDIINVNIGRVSVDVNVDRNNEFFRNGLDLLMDEYNEIRKNVGKNPLPYSYSLHV